MTRTTGRTLALLSLLQGRRDWSGAELRERLEVSDRTLRRDIDDLRELGYGIEATRGRGGGYRLGPGASVPPLTLSTDESVAIAVGLRSAATSVVTGMEEASARALAKLEQSLAPAARTQITEIERAMVPLAAARDDVDVAVVTAIGTAVAERRRLRIDYTRHDGDEARRVVEPHRIVHSAGRWYLVALDPERQAWRTLRVDRMRHPVILREEFPARDIPDDAVRDLASHSITSAPYPHRARARVHARAEVVARAFDPTAVTITADGDDACILSAGTRRPAEFAAYLGMSGFAFDLLDGEEVRTAMVEMAHRLLQAAGPPVSARSPA
ncbi:helix-turn-helix transcriptional regulator [Microbacterium jejuense]|uniref:helix-turn-helix transcriptional regulator n=1 Tax=Microbacterium jejuense TaxID=1263637 RepID=UPI0031F12DCD